MIKSAPTIPPGPAAPLGSSSIADNTARGLSAFCADWCHGVLSLKLIAPHPLVQFKRNCWSISPARQSEKSRLLGMAGALSPLIPHPVNRQSNRYPSRVPRFAAYAPGKENNHYQNTNMQRTAVASAWKRHFSLVEK